MSKLDEGSTRRTLEILENAVVSSLLGRPVSGMQTSKDRRLRSCGRKSETLFKLSDKSAQKRKNKHLTHSTEDISLPWPC